MTAGYRPPSQPSQPACGERSSAPAPAPASPDGRRIAAAAAISWLSLLLVLVLVLVLPWPPRVLQMSLVDTPAGTVAAVVVAAAGRGVATVAAVCSCYCSPLLIFCSAVL